MIYEITNPSDACTIEAEDSVAASVAIILLSSGQYGLVDEDDRTVLPILSFHGPERLIRWLSDNNIDGETYLQKNGDEMAKILESVVYGSVSDRKAITSLTEKMTAPDRLDALANWNDSKRSSVSDISKACHDLAKTLRAKLEA